jgi:hypothetical protein
VRVELSKGEPKSWFLRIAKGCGTSRRFAPVSRIRTTTSMSRRTLTLSRHSTPLSLVPCLWKSCLKPICRTVEVRGDGHKQELRAVVEEPNKQEAVA